MKFKNRRTLWWSLAKKLVSASTLGLTLLNAGQADAGDRPDIYTFSPGQRAALYTLMTNYISSSVVLEHLNPPMNKHNSARFLPWHREYIRRMEEYLIEQGAGQFVPLPKWSPSTNVPDEFFATASTPGGVDPDCPGLVNCNPLNPVGIPVAVPSSLQLPADGGSLCSQLPFYASWPNLSFSRRSLEVLFHNPVHGAVGGAMGDYESPAAPIFWLWHAYVDDIWFEWQCDCGNDENGQIDGYSAAERALDLQANVGDIWMRDSLEDVGNEPNNETTNGFWQSPDMWVRNAKATNIGAGFHVRFSNEHEHQNPEYATDPAQKPWLYAKVRNRGCETMSGQVRFYFANASLGLEWPADFTEVAGSPASVLNVGPGRDAVAEVQWDNIPAPTPSAGSHFCLIARFESSPLSADPINGEMTGVNVGQNARASNNIIWKNVTIVDLVADFEKVISEQVFVKRPKDPQDRVAIRLRETDRETTETLLKDLDVGVKLGKLEERWRKEGGRGQGIERGNDGALHFFGEKPAIEGLLVQEPRTLIAFQFRPKREFCDNEDLVRDLVVEAFDNDGRRLMGGNTYRIQVKPTKRSARARVAAVDQPEAAQIFACNGEGTLLAAKVSIPQQEEIKGYQWYRDGERIRGATSSEYKPTQSGRYSYDVVLANGCLTRSDAFTVSISRTPDNDSPCRASQIRVGTPTMYNNICATPNDQSPGVGTGDYDGCGSRDGWCARDGKSQNSQWYRFVAPSTGTVSISTGEHDHNNMQIAVWSTDKCDDPSSYKLVAANDDGFVSGVWGTGPLLASLGGLVPGKEYLLQIDGFEGVKGHGMIRVQQVEASKAAAPLVAPWLLVLLAAGSGVAGAGYSVRRRRR